MDARTLISEIMRREVSAAADTPLGEVEGWDSLKGVRLVLRLEEIVGRQLSEADIEGLRFVRDIDSILGSTG
jgi:acyl carrier protein